MKRWNRVALLSAVLGLTVAFAAAQDGQPKRTASTPPELCPVWPIYQISETEWVYYADHYSDDSCVVDDCGYLQGNYFWPCDCKDDGCEEFARQQSAEQVSSRRVVKKSHPPSKEFPGHTKSDASLPKRTDSSDDVDKKIKELMPADGHATGNSGGVKAYHLSTSQSPKRYFSVSKVLVSPAGGDRQIYYGFQLNSMPGGDIDYKDVSVTDFVPPKVTATKHKAWVAKIAVDGTDVPVLLLGK